MKTILGALALMVTLNAQALGLQISFMPSPIGPAADSYTIYEVVGGQAVAVASGNQSTFTIDKPDTYAQGVFVATSSSGGVESDYSEPGFWFAQKDIGGITIPIRPTAPILIQINVGS